METTKYLKIQNKGELDIRLIALMGGTTKTNDKYKIGQFGTGLKYTLAYLFRNKIDFKIFIGNQEIKIHTEKEMIAGQCFEIICINGQRTSITSLMGSDWTAWMIIREVYTNALDEGEANYEITDKIIGKIDTTTFYFEMKPEIMEVYNNWHHYFIIGCEPYYQDENVKIFPQKGKLTIYKQGILIHQEEMDSLFNYDFLNCPLNELREYKGFLEYDIYKTICNINDPKVIQYFIENVTDKLWEGNRIDYDYTWSESFNETWRELLKNTKIIHQKAKDNLLARGVKIDEAANITVPEKVYKGLTKHFEGIGALRVSKEINDFYEIYNDALHDRIKQAQKLLEEAGYYIEPELTYVYGIFGDKTILAKIYTDEKKIYLSEKHLDRDLFSICCTLVEENEHYKTGLSDETREFQQHFINLYTNQIIEKQKVDLF